VQAPARRAARSRATSPDRLLDLGDQYMASKLLLTAVSLGLFTVLADGPLREEELRERLGLHPRGAAEFLRGLVALGLLRKEGDVYENEADVEAFLDRRKPAYAGGFLELADARLFHHWRRLGDALRTGEPQNESRDSDNYYGDLVEDAERLRTFLRGMQGLSRAAAADIARRFDWTRHRSFVDLGGADGAFAVEVAKAHPHLVGGSFDLPGLEPYFDDRVAGTEMANRLRFFPGDFFTDALPPADVYVFGHVLHNWSPAERSALIRKAFGALPQDGALLVYELFLDDGEEEALAPLLMSLTMLLVTRDGGASSVGSVRTWMRRAGFRDTRHVPLARGESLVVGHK
jgi:hypothetical protein